MPNRLANEKSLYLRQHAENPVDWYPWGDEAFAKARAENKPVIISVGYSACHWCHVMAHESFENDYIAKLMNEHFVCIKVDREERPDVDRIYMETAQMLNGQGGWPLNAFCLPDGRPFAAGTYFPPDDSRGAGIAPWPQVLMRIRDAFDRQKDQIEEAAVAIVQNLNASNTPLTGGAAFENAVLVEAAEAICKEHDDECGGFGGAPKFPPSMTLGFLLEMRSTRAVEEANPQLARRIDQVVQTTLLAMAHGGMFDQIGGGFARYSVDRQWVIPHFEKMLYDNGLLLDIFAKGWLRYRNPLFRAVAEETADWLLREMRSPDGGFYAAFDADSEGEEGRFYVWTPKEIHGVLGEENGAAFCEAYGITTEGNFEDGRTNPTLRVAEFERRQQLAPLREKLLAARAQRVSPGLDTKRVAAWNALAVRGLAESGFAFGRADLFAAARETADWFWETLVADGRLFSVCHDAPSLNGYLDDYAFAAEAFLAVAAKADAFEPGSSATFIDRAKTLADAILAHFTDTHGGAGYFFTSDDHEALVSRRKEWFDNAIPAGNSTLLHVFSSLHALTGDARYGAAFADLRNAYGDVAKKAPHGVSHALAGICGDALGVAVIKVKGAKTDGWRGLHEAISGVRWRQVFLLHSDDPAQPDGFQLCVGTQCLEPTLDPAELAPKL